MKKNISLALALALVFVLLLSGCGKKAETVTVEVEENPTTGYEWVCSISDENVLTKESDDYKADSASSEATGTGGIHSFVFKAGADGTVTVTLGLAQQWESGQSDCQRIYTYEVKGGKITETGFYETKFLNLPANTGSTGYSWSFAAEPEGVVEITDHGYIVGVNDAPGTPGIQIFAIKPIADGTVDLTFTYGQTWDPQPDDLTATYTYSSASGLLNLEACAEDFSSIVNP